VDTREGTVDEYWAEIYDQIETQPLWRAHRTMEIHTPDGKTMRKEWVQQKHPPSTEEMRTWLEKYDFRVLEMWGNRRKDPYTDRSGRVICWAQTKN
jgi:hypothetical protein